MDAETIRLLAAVAGTLGGAIITGTVAFLVARGAQRTQLLVEREKALRAWRSDRVLPIVTAARQRCTGYRNVCRAFRWNGATAVEPLIRQVEELPSDQVYWVVRGLPEAETPFGQAWLAYRDAEEDVRRELGFFGVSPSDDGYRALEKAVARLELQLVEFDRAVEQYVHALPDRMPEWTPGLPALMVHRLRQMKLGRSMDSG